MSRYLTPPEEGEIIIAYRGGETAREIAERIHRSKTTILKVLARNGIARRPANARDNRGDRNPNWKGGRYLDADGYVYVWTPNGHQREHRVVTGCAGDPTTIVHHRDRNRAHNDPSNLEVLRSHEEHRAAHVAEQRERLGRALHPPVRYGQDNPRAKLSPSQVDEIRRLRGAVSQRELASRFGVSKTAVRHVQKGRNWKLREFPTPRVAVP